MNYTMLLNRLIDKSGKTVKEIATECQTKYNVNLSNTYLSGIKTTEGKIPSSEISVAIAKVCGARYEQVLAVQAYLDRAPKLILDFFDGIRKMSEVPTNLDEMDDASRLMIEDIRNYSMAEFICWYSEQMGIMEKAFEDEPEPEPMWLMLSPEQLKSVRFITDKQARAILKNQE